MTDDRARHDPPLPTPRPDRFVPCGALAFATVVLVGPGAGAPGSVQAAVRAGAGPARPDRRSPDPRRRPGRRARIAAGAAAGATPGPVGPSIIALDAAAHAGRPDPVHARRPRSASRSRPRADDRWTVGGSRPAGCRPGRPRAGRWRPAARGPSGPRARSRPRRRSRWPEPGPPRPVDTTSGPPAPPADPIGYTVQPSRGGRLGTRPRPICAARSSGSCRTGRSATPRTRLDYDLLSTIAYFGVGADADGQPGQAEQRRLDLDRLGRLDQLPADLGHRRRPIEHGTRVVLTVQSFAWTTGQARAQSALLGSAAARLKLARQIAAAVRDRGADGVNLDFEPLASGTGRRVHGPRPDAPGAS